MPDRRTQRVSYNPYKFDSFVDADGAPVYTGKCAHLGPEGVTYA